MAANFDPALSSIKDRARLALGDVGPSYLLQDETYYAILGLDLEPNPMTGAYVSLARALSAVCAGLAIEDQQGTDRKKWIDRAAYYRKLAAEWLAGGVPEDPEFVQSQDIPLVVQLSGPNLDHLNLSTGLGRCYPYLETPTTYLP